MFTAAGGAIARDEAFIPYRHLAIRVLARALLDVSNPSGSANDREGARLFFAGSRMLKRQAWPARPGRDTYTEVRKLGNTEADRNNRMWSKVEDDPQYQALTRHIWDQYFHDPPPTAAEALENKRTLDTQIARAAAAVAKLRARGIPVLFLREPSAGEYLAFEKREFPRATSWDVLLAKTGAPGIHFEDYPELQGFKMPEWSHMTRVDGERFTAALYGIIQREFWGPGATAAARVSAGGAAAVPQAVAAH
jgi:hypothetical protein